MSLSEHRPLFAFEARWITQIFAALFPEPPRGPFPVAITLLDPARYYARLVRQASSLENRLTLRAAVWVTALVAPLVVLRTLRTFGGLSSLRREALLEAMCSSNIYLFRQLAFLLKAQAGQLFCSEPSVRRMIASPGEVLTHLRVQSVSPSRPAPRAENDALASGNPVRGAVHGRVSAA